jgi:ABC-type uncharacterized transport system fused permease/ATPase subunit
MFLQGPEIVVLDEATAALHPQSQDRLMEKLVQRSARMTLISFGHRPELESYVIANHVGAPAGAALDSSVMSVALDGRVVELTSN